VFAFVSSSDASDPINELMKRRGFQIYEWTYTSLPANRAALVESAPAAPEPAAASEPAPAPETETPAETAPPPADATAEPAE
jgi:hypothetical protein